MSLKTAVHLRSLNVNTRIYLSSYENSSQIVQRVMYEPAQKAQTERESEEGVRGRLHTVKLYEREREI